MFLNLGSTLSICPRVLVYLSTLYLASTHSLVKSTPYINAKEVVGVEPREEQVEEEAVVEDAEEVTEEGADDNVISVVPVGRVVHVLTPPSELFN